MEVAGSKAGILSTRLISVKAFVPLPQCSWAVRLFRTAFLKWTGCSSLTSCPLKPDSTTSYSNLSPGHFFRSYYRDLDDISLWSYLLKWVCAKAEHCTTASGMEIGITLEYLMRRDLPIKQILVFKFRSVIAYSANHYSKSISHPSKTDDPFTLRDSLHQMLPWMTSSIWILEFSWQAFPQQVGQHCLCLLW